MNITHRSFLAIFLALWLLSGAGPAFAQGTNLGAIRGTVTDPNGSVLSTPRSDDRFRDRPSRNSPRQEGRAYEATGLKYSVYRVKRLRHGFKISVADNQVALSGGDTVRADVEITVGRRHETVDHRRPRPHRSSLKRRPSQAPSTSSDLSRCRVTTATFILFSI